MPVEGTTLDRSVVARPEVAPPEPPEQPEHHQHADDDVDAVQAGHQEVQAEEEVRVGRAIRIELRHGLIHRVLDVLDISIGNARRTLRSVWDRGLGQPVARNCGFLLGLGGSGLTRFRHIDGGFFRCFFGGGIGRLTHRHLQRSQISDDVPNVLILQERIAALWRHLDAGGVVGVGRQPTLLDVGQ